MKNYKNYILESKTSKLSYKIAQEYLLMQLDSDIDDSKIKELIDLDNIHYEVEDHNGEGFKIIINPEEFNELFNFDAELIEDYERYLDDNYMYPIEDFQWNNITAVKKIKKLFNLRNDNLFKHIDKIIPELKYNFNKYNDLICIKYEDELIKNARYIYNKLPFDFDYPNDIVIVFYYDKMDKFNATTIRDLISETKPIYQKIETLNNVYLSDEDMDKLIEKINHIFDEIYEYMNKNKTEILNNLDLKDYFILFDIRGDFFDHLNTFEYQDNYIVNKLEKYQFLISKIGVGVGSHVFKIDKDVKEKYAYLLSLNNFNI